jgi:hypothetical protein
VVLVTSISSRLASCSHQKVFKVASISKSDFDLESSECASFGSTLPGWQRIRAATVGLLFDVLFKSMAGSRSDGKWSWVLSAVPVILRAHLRFKPQGFVATGGPSAAQFAASIASFAPWVQPPTLEFQDPFIGLEMDLTARTLSAMDSINRLMLRRAKKYVAVSVGSLNRLLVQYPKFKDKLETIYPYASPKGIETRFQAKRPNLDTFEFLHAGTLYGSRTLEPLFSALDDAYAQGIFSKGEVRVVNLGSDYTGSESRVDYEQSSAVSRKDAVRRSSQADCLLLVQHSDSRSLETIPFKLYDYLNLSVPILVLGRNSEIRGLLSDEDFFVEIGDNQALVAALSILVVNRRNSKVPSGRPSALSYQSSWMMLSE